MIILGDVASPNVNACNIISEFFSENKKILESESILFNLEGLLSDNQNLNDNSPILFNHPTILNVFKGFTNRIAALANNHTLDLPHLLNDTKKILKKEDFKSVGAGNSQDTDFNSVEVWENEQQVFVINACWDFLLYHQNNSNPKVKVNIIEEHEILRHVMELKMNNPNAKIVTYFHWSFDLETIPSPSYRIFAKDLIDAGVSLVVGCHSHCVQGGEKYKDGYIVYGLGNFYIPSGVYANGKLNFPKMSDVGWILKWDVENNILKNIWIDTAYNELKLTNIEDFENSPTMQKYTAFSGFSDQEYIKYFKNHRRKNKLNPIFYDYQKSLSNTLKMKALKTRAKVARMAAKWNLINWQN